jgi:hypothetical protein
MVAQGLFQPKLYADGPGDTPYTYTPKPTPVSPVPRIAVYPPQPASAASHAEGASPYGGPQGGPVVANQPNRANNGYACSQYGAVRQPASPVTQAPSRANAASPGYANSPYATYTQQPQAAAHALSLSRLATASPALTTTSSPYASAASSPQMATAAPAYPVQQPTVHLQPSAPAYGSTDGHMPWHNGSHMPMMAVPQPPPVTIDSITRDGLTTRIKKLLEPVLVNWNPTCLVAVSAKYTSIIVDWGQRGVLGPNGLSAYSDIFLSVGYEGKGTGVYMALAVVGAAEVKILLRTIAFAFKGGDVFKSKITMDSLNQSFYNMALEELGRINESIARTSSFSRR